MVTEQAVSIFKNGNNYAWGKLFGELLILDTGQQKPRTKLSVFKH